MTGVVLVVGAVAALVLVGWAVWPVGGRTARYRPRHRADM